MALCGLKPLQIQILHFLHDSIKKKKRHSLRTRIKSNDLREICKLESSDVSDERVLRIDNFAFLTEKQMFKLKKRVILVFVLLELNLLQHPTSASVNNSQELESYTDANLIESRHTDLPATRNKDVRRKSLSCNYAPGLLPGNRKKVLSCCRKTVSRYEHYWASRSYPLSRYLATLKEWNCPQFKQQCRRRLFAFNGFTDLMYDYFCDFDLLVDKCIRNVSEIIKTSRRRSHTKNVLKSFLNSKNASSISEWKMLLKQIQPSQISIDDLLRPCMQIAQLDKNNADGGGFQEIIDFGIPSCSVSWCGIGEETMKFHPVSVWNCLSSGCRSRIITIIVFCGILALAIAIVNFLIIVVLATNSNLQNSQSTYKLSLAFADLLVGLVVLPLIIDTLRRLLWTRHIVDGYYTVKGYEMLNGSLSDDVISVQIPNRAGKVGSKFSEGYKNFAGFFVAVSISVSVYTLAGAGFDRLSAVHNPLSYRKQRAHKIAKRVAVISWIVAIVFGCLPVFTSQLSYRLVLSTVFATLDLNGLILYSVGLLIPLLIVWAINLSTYAFSKKYSKFRRQLTLDAQKKGQLIERRLASTLRLMVGVFTFNTLPLLILIFSSIFIRTISPRHPGLFHVNTATAFVTIEFVAMMLLFGNSLFNFFIYNIKNRDFRVALAVRFARLMKVLGCSACYDTTLVCYRRFVFSGRRRLSSFQSFSRQSFKSRKKSTNASTKVTSVIHIDENGSDLPQNGADDSVFASGPENPQIESTGFNQTGSIPKQSFNLRSVHLVHSASDLSMADIKKLRQLAEDQKTETAEQ